MRKKSRREAKRRAHGGRKQKQKEHIKKREERTLHMLDLHSKRSHFLRKKKGEEVTSAKSLWMEP